MFTTCGMVNILNKIDEKKHVVPFAILKRHVDRRLNSLIQVELNIIPRMTRQELGIFKRKER